MVGGGTWAYTEIILGGQNLFAPPLGAPWGGDKISSVNSKHLASWISVNKYKIL